jgi:hypothetical protein
MRSPMLTSVTAFALVILANPPVHNEPTTQKELVAITERGRDRNAGQGGLASGTNCNPIRNRVRSTSYYALKIDTNSCRY